MNTAKRFSGSGLRVQLDAPITQGLEQSPKWFPGRHSLAQETPAKTPKGKAVGSVSHFIGIKTRRPSEQQRPDAIAEGNAYKRVGATRGTGVFILRIRLRTVKVSSDRHYLGQSLRFWFSEVTRLHTQSTKAAHLLMIPRSRFRPTFRKGHGGCLDVCSILFVRFPALKAET